MFNFRDLFQWERFITPSIIKLFYWLVVVIIILVGLSGHRLGVADDGVQCRRRRRSCCSPACSAC